jgi:hypothetical protein
VVLGLRDKLTHWHHHRDELRRLSHGAHRRADYYSWSRLGERMAKAYREVLCMDAAQQWAEPVAPNTENIRRTAVLAEK